MFGTSIVVINRGLSIDTFTFTEIVLQHVQYDRMEPAKILRHSLDKVTKVSN